MEYRNQKHKIYSSSDWGGSKQTAAVQHQSELISYWTKHGCSFIRHSVKHVRSASDQAESEHLLIVKQVFRSAGNWIQHTLWISIKFSISKQVPQAVRSSKSFSLTSRVCKIQTDGKTHRKWLSVWNTQALSAHLSIKPWWKCSRKEQNAANYSDKNQVNDC